MSGIKFYTSWEFLKFLQTKDFSVAMVNSHQNRYYGSSENHLTMAASHF